MREPDSTAPDPALTSFLTSFTDESYRQREGPLGLLRLLEPTRLALRAYTEQLVWTARIKGASWQDVADALGIPKATAHRNFRHADPRGEAE